MYGPIAPGDSNQIVTLVGSKTYIRSSVNAQTDVVASEKPAQSVKTFLARRNKIPDLS